MPSQSRLLTRRTQLATRLIRRRLRGKIPRTPGHRPVRVAGRGDGTPIEAKDVKWSFERLHNLKGNPSLIMDGLKTVETPDPHTAVVVLDEPNSEFLADVTATFAGIINSTEAAKHGALSTPDAATRRSWAWPGGSGRSGCSPGRSGCGGT